MVLDNEIFIVAAFLVKNDWVLIPSRYGMHQQSCKLRTMITCMTAIFFVCVLIMSADATHRSQSFQPNEFWTGWTSFSNQTNQNQISTKWVPNWLNKFFKPNQPKSDFNQMSSQLVEHVFLKPNQPKSDFFPNRPRNNPTKLKRFFVKTPKFQTTKNGWDHIILCSLHGKTSEKLSRR